MTKSILLITAFSLLIISALMQPCLAKSNLHNASGNPRSLLQKDTVPPGDVMDIISKVIYATNSFNIDAVANLYTPNAVISDDEPPYSWNGPTAGIQWVNTIEKVCRDFKLTKFKSAIQRINVYQQTNDNVFIIVPVNYTGLLPGKVKFSTKGAFTFVLRLVNDKWMIKSQAWMPEKGLKD